MLENKTVVFVRHGQTKDNIAEGGVGYALDGASFTSRGKALSGWNGVPLTMLGVSQACGAGAQLLAVGLKLDQALWVLSPQRRVELTFAGICAGAGLNDRDLRVVVDPGVMERSAGSVTSMTRSDASEIWIPMKAGADASVFVDHEAAYPRGESLQCVYTRAMDALAHYLPQSDLVIVVSHELTIKAMISGLTRDCCDPATFLVEVANAQPIILRSNAEGVFKQAN
jgi:broad specificity phosphatase PhoE